MAKITFINEENNTSQISYTENKEKDFDIKNELWKLFKHSITYIFLLFGLILAFYSLGRLF